MSQLGKKAIQEKIRPHSEKLIKEALELAMLPMGANDSVKLGAIKSLLIKVIPDLKATDLTSDGEKIQGIDVDALLRKAYGNRKKATS